MEKKYKRKKYLIDTGFQLRYIGYPTIAFVMIVLIVSSILYFSIWRTVIKEFSTVKLHEDLQTIVRIREYEGVRTRRFVETVPFLKEEAKMLSEHQLNVINDILIKSNLQLLPILILVVITIIVIGIFLSHRIAGPLFRLKRNMDRILEGDFNVNFTLRKTDELKDLSNKIQLVLHDFVSTLRQVRELVEKLKSTSSEEEKNRCIKSIEDVIVKYRI